jgi:hypothetical protein
MESFCGPLPGNKNAVTQVRMPKVHTVFFEFKEYTALFTLPLSGGGCFHCVALWQAGSGARLDTHWCRDPRCAELLLFRDHIRKLSNIT